MIIMKNYLEYCNFFEGVISHLGAAIFINQLVSGHFVLDYLCLMKTEYHKVQVCYEEDSLFFPKGVRSKTNKRYERWNFDENQDYVNFLRRN